MNCLKGKSYICNAIVIFLAFITFLLPFVVFGQTGDYVSLSPLPGTETVNTGDPGGYLINIFRIFIFVIGTLAVIRLIICGLQYMLSESITSKETAKKCIGMVLGGIAIILLSVVALGIINTDLTKIEFFKSFGEIDFSSGTIPSSPPPKNDPNPSLWCYEYTSNTRTDELNCYRFQEECEAIKQADPRTNNKTDACIFN